MKSIADDEQKAGPSESKPWMAEHPGSGCPSKGADFIQTHRWDFRRLNRTGSGHLILDFKKSPPRIRRNSPESK
jgi:hypothetical protein